MSSTQDLVTPSQAAPAIDLEAVKSKQRVTWASGDFGRVGVTLQIVGETLCEAANVEACDRVLDVAAGNGNASLAAARRFAHVTSTDYVPGLLDQGLRRAEADALDVTFQAADAENLPFPNDTFDVVLSTFGVMFAPNQERAAAELLRVAKPGGRIALASWTPEGFIGQLFPVMSRFVPGPAGLKSPMGWGDKRRVSELFGAGASAIQATPKMFDFRYRSVDHWITFFRTNYGPTHKAFAALDEGRQRELHAALVDFLTPLNTSTRGSLVIPGEYLEVVITKKA